MIRLILVLMILIFANPVWALFGLGVGGHYGPTNIEGKIEVVKDVYIQSSKFEKSFTAGFHFDFTTLPILDFRFDLDFISSKIKQDLGNSGEVELDFSMVRLSGVAKYNIFSPPIFPLKVYIGAGLGLTDLSTDVAYKYLIDDITIKNLKENSKISYIGSAGIRFVPPIIPFTAFGEARITLTPLKDDTVQDMALLIGASLAF